MTGVDLTTILFLDIETVPLTARFGDLPPGLQAHWLKPYHRRGQTDSTAAAEYEAGAIKAEFGRVLCVAMGMLSYTDAGTPQLTVTSYLEDDELTLLRKVAKALDHLSTREDNLQTGQRQVRYLCAHNGREFDFPFLARRMVVRQVALPNLLQVWGKKPWENPFLDTMELWKFGDYKAFTSLDLLAEIFGLPSPKHDISGADVARVYYQERDPERIRQYCTRDVVTLVQVYQYLLQLPLLSPTEVRVG